ncbi:hypothetical protein HYC85_003910 [Camellia sinensis]|uniref:Amino acid transporter transmembrane domain-containing protein n=1 Tax=Camellia sinensis TaxID=4442 RepID=A0A7J7HVZ5_CAMSI|nr:hypothetical protein HYC85_003910 [Camellia sinensis]
MDFLGYETGNGYWHAISPICTLIRRLYPSITSYPDIAAIAFGRKGRITASIFICLELYLVATGLLILEGLKLDGKHSFVVIAGVMIFPSMWLTDLGVLSYISFGGVMSSLIIIVCVFCVGTTKGVGFHGKGSLVNLKGIPTALSLYTFCYGAHAMFPTIYSSMRKKSQFSKVLFLSFIICTITYVSMAILGYLIYGQTVQSQVTLNLPQEKLSSKVAIYTILAGPIAKYSLTITPVATAIENCLPANYHHNKLIGMLIRLVLLISTVILAVLFPSFESVTSLSGAFLIVSVSFLLPCLFYLKIFGVYRNLGYELASIVGIIFMAVLVGIVGTYSSIAQTDQLVNSIWEALGKAKIVTITVDRGLNIAEKSGPLCEMHQAWPKKEIADDIPCFCNFNLLV